MTEQNQRWTYSGKSNPCPICDRTKDTDCRITEDGGMVLCHSEVNGRVKGDQLGNYIWIGSISEPMDWGKWITPNLEPRKNPDYRPTGQKFEFTYQDESGKVACTKVRIYQKQADGSIKKKDWWEPKGVDSSLLLPYRYDDAIAALKADLSLPLLIDESELTADELWQRGIPAIAFGRSLKPVRIKKLLAGYESRLVICVDQDKPGLEKAAKYHKIFPMAATLKPYPESDFWLSEWLPESGGLDVRDWILEGNLSKDQILEAVQRKDSAKQSDSATDTDSDEFEGGKPHFWSNPERGLVWETFEKDPETGETKRVTQRVGNHLEAIAYVDTPESDGAALLLEFKTIRGQIRRWTMPRTGLAGNPAALVDELYRRGYTFKRKQKSLLLDYLCELGGNVEQTYTVTDKTGWLNGSFVLPNKTYGDQTLRFRDIEPSPDCPFEIKGALDGWRSEVAAKCKGNSRLIFSLGTAFAAPLLSIVGIESGGFHLVGGTSQGKTTALSVAASVAGIKEIPHWRTTSNGLESTATAFTHLLLPLDEIGQAEPKDVGAIAYMLANGQGKSRMKRDLSRSPVKTWQLLFLSSGEVGLREYLKQAGISIKGGQEVRLPDLPAIPKDSKYGVFESIHGFESPVEFVNALGRAIKENHGSAIDAFVARLVVNNQTDGFAKELTNRVFAIASELSANYSDAAISRVAKRFALVQVALELTHSYGLLPFGFDQCGWAVKTMFDDWVNARGGDGSIEIKQALERIEHLFVSNEHSDRMYNLDISEGQTVRNLLCYRKKDEFGSESEYWVPPAIFDRELASGVDRVALITELQAIGWLKEPDAEGKNSLRRYLNGKRQRFYVFSQFWSDEKSGVPGVPLAQDAQPEPVSDGTPQDTVRDTAKIEVSRDCTEFDTTRDTSFFRVSREIIPGVPKETPTGQGLQGDGTRGTPGTPQKHKVGNAAVGDSVKISDRSAIATYAPTMSLDLHEEVFQITGINKSGNATICYLGRSSYLLPLDCLEMLGEVFDDHATD